jgi:hypothetical protein
MYVKKNNEIKIKKQFLGAIQILRDTQVGVHTNFFLLFATLLFNASGGKKILFSNKIKLKKTLSFFIHFKFPTIKVKGTVN